MIKVIGKIELPESKDSGYLCDECGWKLHSSFGDPRVKITRIYSDGTEETRHICKDCDYDNFYDGYPVSIFD